MIDYRELLKKYMAFIIEAEGHSYIGALENDDVTEEEFAELEKIERSLDE